MKKSLQPRQHRPGYEALRVSQQTAEIQAALHKHGFRTRKQPKQAAWKIFTPDSLPKTKPFPDSPALAKGETEACFLLTYQTHPKRTWVLYPQNDTPERNTIWNIIRTYTKSAD